MLSASGHKFGGPKGIGFLYIGKEVKLRAFMHGGQQERGRRAGTENVAGIAGMEAAVKRAYRVMEEKAKRETALREYLIEKLMREIPDTKLNGHPVKRLPGNVNVSFASVEGEAVLIMLDMEGICASSGSACTSGALDPSHVLRAIGLAPELARGSVRLTIGEDNTREEIDAAAEALVRIVRKIRATVV